MLDAAKIDYMLSGSGAGQFYGLTRNPNDLDIYFRKKDLAKVERVFKPYVKRKLRWYKDKFFNEYIMFCVMDGIEMDICMADEGFYNSYITAKKESTVKYYYKPVPIKLRDIEVRVQSLEALIRYKDSNRVEFAVHQGADVQELRRAAAKKILKEIDKLFKTLF